MPLPRHFLQWARSLAVSINVYPIIPHSFIQSKSKENLGSLACHYSWAHKYIIQKKQKCLNRYELSKHSGFQAWIGVWPARCTPMQRQVAKAKWPKIVQPLAKAMQHVDPCCVGYPVRAPSSTCFLFFLLLIDTSCWLRVNWGDMTCSSSRTWAYMSMNIPGSPGNSKGGAGWRNCQSWFCAVRQACHAIGSPSVRSSSFISSPGRLDLLVKSRSSLSESGYQPGPLVSSWFFKSRHWGWMLPHMLRTSYSFRRWWKS